MSQRPHVQLVMGVQNAMPADERLLDILLAETRRVIPGATWTAAGIGRHQSLPHGLGLAARCRRGANRPRGQHPDQQGSAASGSAELVSLAVELISRHGCRPATSAEARAVLGLRAP